MKNFVLDASVALGWILDNPVPRLATRAKQALLSGTRAVVPALWHLEIAKSLIVAEREGFSPLPTPCSPSCNSNNCLRKRSTSKPTLFRCGRRFSLRAPIGYRRTIRFI